MIPSLRPSLTFFFLIALLWTPLSPLERRCDLSLLRNPLSPHTPQTKTMLLLVGKRTFGLGNVLSYLLQHSLSTWPPRQSPFPFILYLSFRLLQAKFSIYSLFPFSVPSSFPLPGKFSGLPHTQGEFSLPLDRRKCWALR